MKKVLIFLLSLVLSFSSLTGCSGMSTEDVSTQDQQEAKDSGLESHKIGVATYNVRDAQIMMFKEYLDGYIKECFPDVSFLYSDSLSGSEDLMDFLSFCAESGVEGVMLFGSYDLQKEAAFCAENEMYMIRPSATSSDEDFEAVASNPYYVGEIGPGTEMEYKAGADMAETLAKEGETYLIFSSGASEENEMHRLRTLGILDTLQKIYGVEFEQSPEELAVVDEPTNVEAGDLKFTIFPGYLESEENSAAAAGLAASGEYTTILSTVPVSPIKDTLDTLDIHCGAIDCFSEDNYYGFRNGTISYVAGKYQSEIGPGFAALYNAVTGNGEVFREDGKAFRLEQGFWIAESSEEYSEMYSIAELICQRL